MYWNVLRLLLCSALVLPEASGAQQTVEPPAEGDIYISWAPIVDGYPAEGLCMHLQDHHFLFWGQREVYAVPPAGGVIGISFTIPESPVFRLAGDSVVVELPDGVSAFDRDPREFVWDLQFSECVELDPSLPIAQVRFQAAPGFDVDICVTESPEGSPPAWTRCDSQINQEAGLWPPEIGELHLGCTPVARVSEEGCPVRGNARSWSVLKALYHDEDP